MALAFIAELADQGIGTGRLMYAQDSFSMSVSSMLSHVMHTYLDAVNLRSYCAALGMNDYISAASSYPPPFTAAWRL